MVNKIRGYRGMLSKSQSEMSKLLNITSQSYSSKENGKRPFTDKEKVILKEYFSNYFPEIDTIDFLFF